MEVFGRQPVANPEIGDHGDVGDYAERGSEF